jgi:hypothetical protein
MKSLLKSSKGHQFISYWKTVTNLFINVIGENKQHLENGSENGTVIRENIHQILNSFNNRVKKKGFGAILNTAAD